MHKDETIEWVRKAYKKLKGSVYFDKTQLPLLHDIVCFEGNGIENELAKLVGALDSSEDDAWDDFSEDICSKIDACFR